MGNTTIIELDHDRTYEIQESPDTFLRAIREQCASFEHTGQRIPGGRIIAGFHRSGPMNDAWNKFVKAWGSYRLWPPQKP